MSFHLIKGSITSFRNQLVYSRNQILLFFRRLVKEQHQLTSTTGLNRYPELFSEVRKLRSIFSQEPSVLSFGCSTGEECFSIKEYFPDAKILGLDINRSNLRKAKSKNKYQDVVFRFSSRELIAKNGPYDMVFALSVLCRWEDTKNLESCASVYPFTKYSETVRMLCLHLKPGGLLIIYNSNFRFEETDEFRDFEIVTTPSVLNSGFVHKFDRNNFRVAEEHKHCVYKKKV